MENNSNDIGTQLPTGIQTSIFEGISHTGSEPVILNPFALSPEEELRRRKIAQHKAWLASFPHECPSPYNHYRIGVYIRFFNQTKYSNYLDYHKQQFIDTIGLCPNWELIGFYVDVGQTAPNMESAKEWCRLLDDCLAGKIDLIITQKVSNVTRKGKAEDIVLISRLLATMPHPVGMYFISEDIFTLASYYQDDLRDRSFFPSGWAMLPDDPNEEILECESIPDRPFFYKIEGGALNE